MKEIRKPKTKGVANTPLVMQLEALECGAASLTMVMAYYGKWVALEQVRVGCGVSRNGSNAKNILRAAQKYGFKTRGCAYNIQKLKEKGYTFAARKPTMIGRVDPSGCGSIKMDNELLNKPLFQCTLGDFKTAWYNLPLNGAEPLVAKIR